MMEYATGSHEVEQLVQNLDPSLRGYFASNAVTVAVNRALEQAAISSVPDTYNGLVDTYVAVNDAAERHKRIDSLMHFTAGLTADENQNYRDTAVTITSILLSSEAHKFQMQIGQKAVIDSYISAVQSLDADVDYFGAPHSMMELGAYLARDLGKTQDQALHYTSRARIRETWTQKFLEIDPATRGTVGNETIENLVSSFVPYEAAAEAKGWNWARKEPTFQNTEQKQLNDHFLGYVKTQGTYKPFLSKSSSELHDYAYKKGVNVEQFWNLGDTATTHKLLGKINEVELLQPAANRYLEKYTGNSSDTLSADSSLGDALTDEVITAAESLITDTLTSSSIQPETTWEKLFTQVKEAQSARRPSRKLAPVKNFLSEFGIDTDGDAATLAGRMEATREVVISQLQAKQATILDEVQQLRDILDGNPRYPNLEMGRKDEKDLFAGDYSSDCTAYHIECGFNAWTTPLWLANPCFNMMYALDDNGARVAKLGVLLTENEQGPAIVVDSIETFDSVDTQNNQLFALEGIYKAFHQLTTWADAQGYNEVYCCTYTNSTELTMQLPIVKQEGLTALRVFGGTLGLQEVTRTVTQKPNATLRQMGYLQSAAVDEAEQDTDEGLDESTSKARLYIERLILRLPDNTAAIQAARDGDYAAFLSEITKVHAPHLTQLYGERIGGYISDNPAELFAAARLVTTELHIARMALADSKFIARLDAMTNSYSEHDSEPTFGVASPVDPSAVASLFTEDAKHEQKYEMLRTKYLIDRIPEDRDFAPRIGNNSTYDYTPAFVIGYPDGESEEVDEVYTRMKRAIHEEINFVEELLENIQQGSTNNDVNTLFAFLYGITREDTEEDGEDTEISQLSSRLPLVDRQMLHDFLFTK